MPRETTCTRCEEEISVFKSRLSLHYPLPSSFSCPKPPPPPFRSVSLFRPGRHTTQHTTPSIPVCERVFAAPPPPNSSGGRVNNLELPADGALEGLSFEPTTLLRCTTLSFSGHLTPVNDTRSSKKLRASARLGHWLLSSPTELDWTGWRRKRRRRRRLNRGVAQREISFRWLLVIFFFFFFFFFDCKAKRNLKSEGLKMRNIKSFLLKLPLFALYCKRINESRDLLFLFLCGFPFRDILPALEKSVRNLRRIKSEKY